MKFSGIGLTDKDSTDYCARCASAVKTEEKETGRFSTVYGTPVFKRRYGCPKRGNRFFSRHTLTTW